MTEASDPLLDIVLNLSRYHREHEKFYSESLLHDAITLQRASRALKALAERWSEASPDATPSPSPYAGARDLNDERAIETLGILFMEGEGEPAELTRLKADLALLAARDITRALAVLEHLSLTPQDVRGDLAGERQFPAYVFASAELLDDAADLLARSATLVHENERRWRVFHARVEAITGGGGAPG